MLPVGTGQNFVFKVVNIVWDSVQQSLGWNLYVQGICSFDNFMNLQLVWIFGCKEEDVPWMGVTI
jgi:hypothetical protein